jgi:hypothetical protein
MHQKLSQFGVSYKALKIALEVHKISIESLS